MIAAALKAKWMELRKAKDPQAAFLGLIQSDAQGLAKKQNSENPVVSDDNALQAIRAGIKKGEDTLRLIAEKGGQPDAAVQAEVALLTQLLPPQASEDQLLDEIKAFVDSQVAAGTPVNMKLMGPTIKHLEAKFGAGLDRAKASMLVKTAVGG